MHLVQSRSEKVPDGYDEDKDLGRPKEKVSDRNTQDNIFRFSENEYDEYRDLIREDAKRAFRLGQIEAEGNDPVETGKSYGTPHDLASLYGKGRYQTDPGNVPDGYDEDKDLGRPKEKVSDRNTQDDAFGPVTIRESSRWVR